LKLQSFRQSKKGVARILETVIAAAIIFMVFTASSFFVFNSKANAVQDRSDIDRLGYNVLSRLTESGTIDATVETSPPQYIQLKAFIQNALPSGMLFNLTITKCTHQGSGGWITLQEPATVSNTDGVSFSSSLAVSSTPMMYTSRNGNIYSLVLVLANSGEGKL
jgi:hypothetical protein